MDKIIVKKPMWQCPLCDYWFGSFEGLMKHTHTMQEVGNNWDKLINKPNSCAQTQKEV